MNKLYDSAQVFDPKLISLLLKQDNDDSTVRVINANESRDLFYQLNQSEYSQGILPRAYEFISTGLIDTERQYSASMAPNYSKKNLSALHVLKLPPIPKSLLSQHNLNNCIEQFVPVQLTQPVWLQNISQISSCKSVLATQLMAIFLQLTRTEQGELGILDSYRSLLLATAIKIPILHNYSYSQQTSVITEMFDFASTQLALARFPRVFFPEILGFTLAYCQMPSFIEICFPDHQLSCSFFDQHQDRVEKQYSPLLKCISFYLDQFPEQDLWQRIQNGFYLYQLKMQRCRDQFMGLLENPCSPQQQIINLLHNKAVAAIGHHNAIYLNGKPLDAWFAGLPKNSREFLQALKQSDYVNGDEPANSPLLKLFEFKGPMFGVLNEKDIEILRKGLKDELKDKHDESSVNYKQSEEKKDKTINSSIKFESTIKCHKLSTRELYYYLLNADLFPNVLSIANNKLHKLLRYCALLNPPPFKHYSHQQFDTFIEDTYRREVSIYKPLQGIPKTSREAYIWGIEQIAPMILIDGCWLQNSLTLQNINPQIAEILFAIYCDEIGNGHQQQNHPYIFKQLLDSLSIDVPPVYSAEFTKHPGFINRAFDLPVYMLSLSNFTVEFLPELLGLNMAIELSGLGNGYLRLVDEWNYWGIDPTIAKIHISIDNFASGHTFLAKQVVQLSMDDILQRTGDQQTLNKHWERIYCGYASLRFVGGMFKMALPVCYLIHKLRAKTV